MSIEASTGRCAGAILALALSACSTVGVRVPVTHPAEINLRGKSELAIGEFRGDHGPAVAGALKEALARCGRFKILDRQHLDQVLTELKLSVSELADPSARSRLGQLMGGSILLIGNVDRYRYDEQIRTEHTTCDDGKGKKKPCDRKIRSGRSDVMVSFDVIDVATGENLKPKQLKASQAAEQSSTLPDEPAGIDGQGLIDQSVNEVVNEFMKSIAPWQDYQVVKFKKDGDLPPLASGIAYAEAGQWPEALDTFKKAVDAADSRPDLSVEVRTKAHWDLGLAYEYTAQFDLAEAEVKKAYAMGQDGDMLAEVQHIANARAEHQRLQEQLAPATQGGTRAP